MAEEVFIPGPTIEAPLDTPFEFGGVKFDFNGGRFGLAQFNEDDEHFPDILQGIAPLEAHEPKSVLVVFGKNQEPTLLVVHGEAQQWRGGKSFTKSGEYGVITFTRTKRRLVSLGEYMRIYRFSRPTGTYDILIEERSRVAPFPDHPEGHIIDQLLPLRSLHKEAGGVELTQDDASIRIKLHERHDY